MSAALLAKLKVKKQPKIRESVEIMVQVPSKKEDVTIRTKVVDMTKTAGIDRDKFMKSIVSKEVTKKDKPIEPMPVVQETINVPKKQKKRLKLVAAKTTVAKPDDAKPDDAKPDDAKPDDAKPDESPMMRSPPFQSQPTINLLVKKLLLSEKRKNQ